MIHSLIAPSFQVVFLLVGRVKAHGLVLHSPRPPCYSIHASNLPPCWYRLDWVRSGLLAVSGFLDWHSHYTGDCPRIWSPSIANIAISPAPGTEPEESCDGHTIYRHRCAALICGQSGGTGPYTRYIQVLHVPAISAAVAIKSTPSVSSTHSANTTPVPGIK